MKKSSDPVDSPRERGASHAEHFVHAAAERIAPLAEAAAEAIGNAADRVSPIAHAAAERVAPLAHGAAGQAHSAAERLGPLVHDAAGRVGPLTSQTVEKIGPIAHQAVDRVTPLAHQAAAAMAPLAHQAAERVTPLAVSAAEAVGPYAALARERSIKAGYDAADRLAPAVATARERLSEDVLPKVSAALAAAAASPVVADVAERGRALVHREHAEPLVVVPPPRRRGRVLTTIAVVAAGAAAAYVLARKLLGDKGSQWQTARPSAPYVPPTSTASSEAPASSETAEGTTGGATSPDTTELYGAPMDDLAVDDADTTAENEVNATTDRQADLDEGAPPAPGTDASSDDQGHSDQPVDQDLGSTSEHDTAVGGAAPVSTEDDNEAGVGPDAHPATWSERGAYVGVEPPEGYSIKANERSMKYHLPDSSGYGRTISEIWFASEEAAQAAGFVRAQG